MQLPIIWFHGLRWFVDVRLQELRQADTWDLTPLPFAEFEAQATPAELYALDEAIIIYYLQR